MDFLKLSEWSSRQFWGNTVGDYSLSLAIFVIAVVVFHLLKVLLVASFSKKGKGVVGEFADYFADLLRGVSGLFYFTVAVYLALQPLVVDPFLMKWVNTVVVVIVVYELLGVAQSVFEFVVGRILIERSETKAKAKTMLGGLSLVFRIVLWTLAILLVLTNFGFNVNTLLASLGIGGIAVALAVQNILSDIFNSFSLYFDRPFEIGDFVELGEMKGRVVKIGLKSTRLKTLDGETLVISNKEFNKVVVRNFKKATKHRVAMKLHFATSTKVSQINTFIAKVKADLSELAEVVVDRVSFSDITDQGLVVEIIYHVEVQEMSRYLEIKESVNFLIKGILEKSELELYFGNFFIQKA